jgi:hypothetical protein
MLLVTSRLSRLGHYCCRYRCRRNRILPSDACLNLLTSRLCRFCRYRRRCHCRRHRILPPDACCCLQAASSAADAVAADAAESCHPMRAAAHMLPLPLLPLSPTKAASAVAADATESCAIPCMHACAHKLPLPPLPLSPPLSLPTSPNPATRCMLLLTSRLSRFCHSRFCRHRRRCRCRCRYHRILPPDACCCSQAAPAAIAAAAAVTADATESCHPMHA